MKEEKYFVFSSHELEDFTQVKLKFNSFLFNFYEKNKRNLKWREDINPFYILVSEFMLQQTQVSRVIPFFEKFIDSFPSMEILAKSTQNKVLTLWNGLGYNKRALYLHNAAKEIFFKHNNIISKDPLLLQKIKGIGIYTSSAIVTYTHNIPKIFVETNIRSVFLIFFEHYFINNKIHDKEIFELIEKTIDKENPRQWYYALMDLGTILKKIFSKNHLKKSHSYQKQSSFKNSLRELRGKVIKIIIQKKFIFFEEISLLINDIRLQKCLEKLKKELLITQEKNIISLKE